VHYRRCATAPLARADGFATSSGRVLSDLVATSAPTSACRQRVLALPQDVRRGGLGRGLQAAARARGSL
jgi:hypothetical protein